MSGRAQLDRHLARLEALARMPASAAPVIADAVERELVAQIGRGVDPDGKPWPKTKEGETPLRNASSALSVTAAGGAVVASVEGPEALHDQGKARGHVQRRILPRGALPSRLSTAIGDALDLEFGRIMAGGGGR